MGDAWAEIVRHPYEYLVRRWNWKSASVQSRGGVHSAHATRYAPHDDQRERFDWVLGADRLFNSYAMRRGAMVVDGEHKNAARRLGGNAANHSGISRRWTAGVVETLAREGVIAMNAWTTTLRRTWAEVR